jgi:hypothetical protein
VTAPEVLTRTIRIANKGTADATYNVSYEAFNDAAGVAFSVSPPSVTVAGSSTEEVTVTLTLTPADMRHTRDAAMAATVGSSIGNQPRFWMTEETGQVKFESTATAPTLRVPVHVAARAASTMAASSIIATAGNPTGSVNVALSGTEIATGSAFPVDVVSLVSGFELQTVSVDDAGSTGDVNSADIRYAGITSDAAAGGANVFFAISTWQKWNTPQVSEIEFDIYIDVNQDATYDYVLYNLSPPLAGTSHRTDVLTSRLLNLGTNAGSYVTFLNGISPASLDTVVFNTDSIIMQVPTTSLTVAGDSGPAFNYEIRSFHRDSATMVDSTPVRTFNPSAAGLDWSGGFTGVPTWFDLDGEVVPVNFNKANLAANGSLGGLLIHHHNADGNRAQVVLVCDPITLAPVSLPAGTTGTAYSQTLTATGGTGAYTFSVVNGTLPAGLTLAADGTLSGVPTLAGSFTFTVQATDGGGCPGTQEYTVDIAASFAIGGIAPDNGSGGTSITLTGIGFTPATMVTIGGLAATVTFVDSNTLTVIAPALPPGTVNDVVVTEGTASVTGTGLWMADFLDVPQAHLFHDFVEAIFRAGFTAGCGGGNYCVDASVTRAQMAVFVLRGIHGLGYAPPPATGTIFADVPAGSFAAAWIEQFYNEGITAGCATSPLRYCPEDAVSRSQMAVFLLRAKHGLGYVPPPATGIFEDVPVGSFAADWIEQLYNEGITAGCGTSPLRFCPNDPTTRGSMAVFLSATFMP